MPKESQAIIRMSFLQYRFSGVFSQGGRAQRQTGRPGRSEEMARHLSTGSFVKPIICKRQTRRPGKPQRLPRNGMNCIPLFITSGLVEMNLCFQDSSFFCHFKLYAPRLCLYLLFDARTLVCNTNIVFF